MKIDLKRERQDLVRRLKVLGIVAVMMPLSFGRLVVQAAMVFCALWFVCFTTLRKVGEWCERRLKKVNPSTRFGEEPAEERVVGRLAPGQSN